MQVDISTSGDYAIIGGSGLQALKGVATEAQHLPDTPFGKTSGPISSVLIGKHRAFFIPRHGVGHTIAPHLINYRANIWALKDIGATKLVSVASVGGIPAYYEPGTLLVPEQIIDYTWGRASTFFGEGVPVKHIDFTNPFSNTLRDELLRAAKRCNLPVADGGVYAATQGPRLETAAEINRIERDGGNVVGMTGMPEAVLARECGLEYAMLAVVVNSAAGRGESAEGILFADLAVVADMAMCKVEAILKELVSQ